MYYLLGQPWLRPDEEIVGDIHWNLWSVRQQPYNQLEVGDRLLLCSPSPEGSRITYEVGVTHVARSTYSSARQVWDVLDAAFPTLRTDKGWTFGRFKNSPYMEDRPNSGHLLGYSYEVLQELQIPRPAAWKLRPNGYLPLADADVTPLLDSAPAGGQGRLLNSVLRRAVELRAMEAARQWLVEDCGYAPADIRDTSTMHPYDFEVGPVNAPVLRVEVKGLSGPHGPVFVTAGEVRSAQSAGVPTDMVIVSHIRLRHVDDAVVGEGGQLNTVSPWMPTTKQLKPELYRYTPPKAS